MINQGTTPQWRSYLLHLKDSTFFNLMRNYIGEFPTPFHKPELIEKLQRFLSQPENQKGIILRITPEDRHLLTAVALTPQPTPARLLEIMGDETLYRDLRNRLVNLEERLLIYTEGGERAPVYRINPLLAPVLQEQVLSPAGLFQARSTDPDPSHFCWMNEGLLIAFISFCFSGVDLYRNDGTLKKQAKGRLEKIWGTLFSGDDKPFDPQHPFAHTHPEGRLSTLIQSLKTLGILQDNQGKIDVNLKSWLSLAQETALMRWQHLYAGLYLSILGQESSISQNRSSDKAAVQSLIPSDLFRLPPDQSFTREGILRLLKTTAPQAEAPVLLKTLLFTGFMETRHDRDEASAQELRYQRSTHLPWAEKRGGREEPSLVVQPNHECVARPWISLQEGARLAVLADITSYDLFPHFLLCKKSYMRARDSRFSRQEMTATLEELSRAPLPSEIDALFQSWEEEYNSLTLYQGVFLSVSPDRRILVEHNEALQENIIKEIAPGIYWLDPAREDQWRPLLLKGGFESLPVSLPPPRFPYHHKKQPAPPQEKRIPPIRTEAPASPAEDLFPLAWTPPREEPPHPQKVEKSLFEALKKNQWDNKDREELTDRIIRGVIVSPEQLLPGLIRREKRQARGMDFSGKVRLIEQTLMQPDDQLEIAYAGEGADLITQLVRPLEINRRQGDMILEAQDSTGQPLSLAVRKLAAVRRISQSLFS